MEVMAYRTELNPTNKQIGLIHQYCGTVRFAYNWYLDAAKAYYAECGLFLTGYAFSKALNNSKRPEWFTEAPSKSVKHAIMCAERAYRRFFKRQSGFPRYKRRNTNRDSFYVICSIHVERHRIRLPKLGWVKLKEKGYVPTRQEPKSATISIVNGRYYVSVLYEAQDPAPIQPTGEPLGMDVGLKNLAVLSDGTVFMNINKTNRLRKLEKRKRRIERMITRRYLANKGKDKVHGWHNYRKAIMEKWRIERRLNNRRVEYMKWVCAQVVRRQPSSLIIEHLNVKGMMKNRHLAPALHKQGLSVFLELVEQVCHKHGIELRRVSAWYPSSRLCHVCHRKNTSLVLGQYEWRCPVCGTLHDRDLNAALNLRDASEYQDL